MVGSRKLPLVAVIVALGAVAGGAEAGARSGLWGVVTRSPISPICVAEQPCDAPAPGVTLVFTHADRSNKVLKAY